MSSRGEDTTSVSVVYITGRLQPHLEWLIDGIEDQAEPGDAIELIVVDARGRPAEAIGFRPIPAIRRVVATPPKPCPWQGPQRVTPLDWWAVSNARNTGIALCQSDHVVFLDDRCRIGPAWLDVVRRSIATRSSVLAGAYDKLEVDGQGGTRVSVDHRVKIHPGGLADCGGGWLYGCAVAMPLEWALEVNGFEEGVDSLSGEDYLFGMMLGNRGRRVDFEPRLHVSQDRTDGADHGMRRTDKGSPPADKSHAALERFGRLCRTEFTPDLRDLRGRIAAGGGFPDVDRGRRHVDWFDGQPIEDMRPPP